MASFSFASSGFSAGPLGALAGAASALEGRSGRLAAFTATSLAASSSVCLRSLPSWLGERATGTRKTRFACETNGAWKLQTFRKDCVAAELHCQSESEPLAQSAAPFRTEELALACLQGAPTNSPCSSPCPPGSALTPLRSLPNN